MTRDDLDELELLSNKITACGIIIDLVLPHSDELLFNDKQNVSFLIRELLDTYSHRIEAIAEKEIAYNAEKRKALTQAKQERTFQRAATDKDMKK